MDIDALHSALLSLTLLPEQLRSARENLAHSPGEALAAVGGLLGGIERDIRVAKATLACELGFPVCRCCWPAELLIVDRDGQSRCPSASEKHTKGQPPRRFLHPTRANRADRRAPKPGAESLVVERGCSLAGGTTSLTN